MRAEQIIAAVRKHRGAIYAGVLGANDVIYFQVTKASVIREFTDFHQDLDNEFSVRVVDGCMMYIDSAPHGVK